ncbi:MAG: hypothetical protein JWL70_683 [Acidimicrobiia bacterium]|nr:hypothetical protein [Acidimicrobiia bacterium]
MKLIRTTAAATLTAGLALGAFAGIAQAAPTSGTGATTADVAGTTKARCDAAIDKRVNDLATWTSKVNAASHLTADQRTTLVNELTATSTGLTTVAKPAVDNAADKAALKAACRAIVENYRVYLVIEPQVRLTAAADAEQAGIADLQTKAAAAKASGIDTSAVDALLTTAAGLESGAASKISPITPASYNADPAGTKAVFVSVRSDLRQGHLDVVQARRALAQLTHR